MAVIEKVNLRCDAEIPTMRTLNGFMKHLFEVDNPFVEIYDSSARTEYFIEFRTISIENHTFVGIFI